MEVIDWDDKVNIDDQCQCTECEKWMDFIEAVPDCSEHVLYCVECAEEKGI